MTVEITGMYAQLIEKNEKMPDPRAGSTPVLGGACPHPRAVLNIGIDPCPSIRRRLPCLRKCHDPPSVDCPHRAG